MTDNSPAIDALTRLALPTGGWGYWSGQAFHLEPTCLATLALAAEKDKHRLLIDRAIAALETQIDGTGLYRLDRGRPQAVWPTAMVVATRAALGLDVGAIRTPTVGHSRPHDQGRSRSPEHVRHRLRTRRLAVGRRDVRVGRADRLGVFALRAAGSGPSSACDRRRQTAARSSVRYGRHQLRQSAGARPHDRADPRPDGDHAAGASGARRATRASGATLSGNRHRADDRPRTSGLGEARPGLSRARRGSCRLASRNSTSAFAPRMQRRPPMAGPSACRAMR